MVSLCGEIAQIIVVWHRRMVVVCCDFLWAFELPICAYMCSINEEKVKRGKKQTESAIPKLETQRHAQN